MNSPKLFKRMINLNPPYLGAGIKIEHISADWKELHVSMALRWYTPWKLIWLPLAMTLLLTKRA